MTQLTCEDIRQQLKKKYKNEEFVIDKTGVKTVELINAAFLADRDWVIRKPNYKYFEKELQWYKSQSTNIKDIYGAEKDPPKAWVASADAHGNINSNYGALIYSDKYYTQYKNCLKELIKNPNSRRATMVYNRPSIWTEYNEAGKSDFICTYANQFFVRDGKLVSVYIMRSNDCTIGYCNDNLWARNVQSDLALDLDLEIGDLYWSAMNFHVYERDFKFLEDSYDPNAN